MHPTYNAINSQYAVQQSLPIWGDLEGWSRDPMFEKYPSISPYTYCANNPMKFVDPTGQTIEEGSQEEWNLQKNAIISKIALLEKRGNSEERVKLLKGTLETMTNMEKSDVEYSLKKVDGDGGLSATEKGIQIKFSSTGLFVHEVTHAGQYENQKVGFFENGNPAAWDLYDEVDAYKSQYAFNPGEVSLLWSNTVANSLNDITADWVKNIFGVNKKGEIEYPYKDAGLNSVDMNSTRDALIAAYPKMGINPNLNSETTLKELEGIKYKKTK